MSDVKVPDLNRLIMGGRLTRDPELQYISTGKAKARFTVANERRWKDSAGQWQKEVHFQDCVAWGPLAEALGERARKGDPVIIEGSMRTNQWADKQGVTQKRTECTVDRVHSLQWPDKDGDGQAQQRPAAQQARQPEPAQEDEDDCPF